MYMCICLCMYIFVFVCVCMYISNISNIYSFILVYETKKQGEAKQENLL